MEREEAYGPWKGKREHCKKKSLHEVKNERGKLHSWPSTGETNGLEAQKERGK